MLIPRYINFLLSDADWSCAQNQIGLLLKIDLATGNHVGQTATCIMWVDGAYYPGRATHLGVFSRPSHKTRKWQLCQKTAFHNLGDSSFIAGVNRL